MRPFLILIIMSLSLNLQAQSAEKVVNSFFEALNNKNPQAIDSLTLDDLKLHSLQIHPQSPMSITTKKEFLQSLKAIPDNINIEEKIFDVDSMVTDHLAQYKIPYKFYINGELSHSGTNVFTLVLIENKWYVSYIADTRKKPE